MSLDDFSMPMHKSLLIPDMVFGIPRVAFFVVFFASVCSIYFFGKWGAVVIPVVYFPMKLLSKKDPRMIEIALGSLLESDHLEA